MDPMPNNTGGDAVTITEALERLGSQAPVRPTFIQAVKRGKIRKVTDKNAPEGQIMVSWSSVLKYIANGGFKPRKQPASDKVAAPESTLTPVPKDEAVVEVGNLLGTKPSPTLAIPQVSNTQRGTGRPPAGHRPSGKGSKSAKSTDSAMPGAKRYPTPRDRAGNQPKPDRGDAAAKGRRSLPLRQLKNLLRHLDFEQTKSIRDWADNRLLSVLRPTTPAPDGVVEAITKSA